MECELCGRHSQLVRAEVEGSILSVCSNCARFGKIMEVKTHVRQERPATVQISVIDPNFAKIVKNNRALLNMSVKELGEKINEKSFVIERVERGMRPTDALAQKLEKALNTKLLGYEEIPVTYQKYQSEGTSIADVATIRKKK